MAACSTLRTRRRRRQNRLIFVVKSPLLAVTTLGNAGSFTRGEIRARDFPSCGGTGRQQNACVFAEKGRTTMVQAGFRSILFGVVAAALMSFAAAPVQADLFVSSNSFGPGLGLPSHNAVLQFDETTQDNLLNDFSNS